MAKNLRVQPGQVLEVTLPEPEEPEARPQDIPLDVVYEDEDVIVVNKPTGMVVHPAPGHPDGTLVNALLYHCGESLSGVGGQKRPGIVHRIDRDTSGLIIAAKNDAAHLALAAQLADHTLARTYECLAVGNFREDSGTVDAPIGRHPVDRKRMAVVLAVASPICAAVWNRAAPTRSGSTWPTTTPSWGYPWRADRPVPPRVGLRFHPPPHRRWMAPLPVRCWKSCGGICEMRCAIGRHPGVTHRAAFDRRVLPAGGWTAGPRAYRPAKRTGRRQQSFDPPGRSSPRWSCPIPASFPSGCAAAWRMRAELHLGLPTSQRPGPTTWPTSATRFWGIRCMGPKSPCRG